jgi:hypothetical protein
MERLGFWLRQSMRELRRWLEIIKKRTKK